VPELFLDASYAIALASRTDAYHDRAVALATALQLQRTTLVTTRAVLMEIGNALGKPRHRAAACALLGALERDDQVVIVPAGDQLYAEAFALYAERQDKEWGLTDCMSFVVMRARGLTEALTADVHFRQAGFRALLLEG